jgi:hypothetical protein
VQDTFCITITIYLAVFGIANSALCSLWQSLIFPPLLADRAGSFNLLLFFWRLYVPSRKEAYVYRKHRPA